MKHPNREQWMDYLYEECNPAEKSELAAHLKSCAACRGQFDTWRSAGAALNEYAVEARPQPTWRATPWLRWSAAAALFIAVGIGVGSNLQSRGNSAQAQLIVDLRHRVEKSEAENARTQRLLVELSQTMAQNRAQDQAALVEVAREVAATRKDVETVAIMTEAGLKGAVRLAGYNPAVQ